MGIERGKVGRILQLGTSGIIALSLLLLSGTVFGADCSWVGPSPNWNHYYNGRLGNNGTVRLVLAFRRCKASGEWFDSINLKDFRVAGSLSRDRAVTLVLYGATGHIVAKLDGTFTVPYLSVVGNILGTHGYHGQRVELKLSRLWNGTDAEVARAVGIVNRTAFNRATLTFWKAVRDHNSTIVSKCIRYPLRATIYGKDQSARNVTITNAPMLKRDYDEIFNTYRRDAIVSHLPRHLIWGYYSNTIRLGNNAVLFNPEGQVIALP
jgi:hypothetical protein